MLATIEAAVWKPASANNKVAFLPFLIRFVAGRFSAERGDVAFAVIFCSSTELDRIHRPGCSQLFSVPTCRLCVGYLAASPASWSPRSPSRWPASDQRTESCRDTRTGCQEASYQWRSVTLSARLHQLRSRVLLIPSHPHHVPWPSGYQAFAAPLGSSGSQAARTCGCESTPKLHPRPQRHRCLRRQLLCLPIARHRHGSAQPQPQARLHQHGASV